MSPIMMGLIVVVALGLLYGFSKLIMSEEVKNDSTDTVRDNNTDEGVQDIKRTKNTGNE